MTIGAISSSHISYPPPANGVTGNAPGKTDQPSTPGTVQNHVFARTTEYANADIEVSQPSIDPSAIQPFVIGRQRIVQPQVLWYGDYHTLFTATTHEETTTVTESKQLSYEVTQQVETTTTTTVTTMTPTDYSMTVVLGLCLGPNVVLRAIYSANELVWEGTTVYGRNDIDVSGNAVIRMANPIFYSGQNNATPDPLLEALIGTPNLVPGFVGTSYVIIPGIASKVYSQASLTFEVERWDFNRRLSGDDYADPRNADGDVNAAAMLFETIRSDWSAMATPPANIDEDTFKHIYDKCADKGYYFSYQDASDDFGANLLDTVQALTGIVLYLDLDAEKIKASIYIYSEYDPDTAVQLDASNIVSIREAPRLAWNTVPTHYEITYTDREQNYRTVPVRRVSRSVNVDDKKSEERLAPLNAQIACSAEVAQKCITRHIMHNGVPVQQVTVDLTGEPDGLYPGGVMEITWPRLDFDQTPFFVQTIAPTDDELNVTTVTGFYFTRPDANDFDDMDDGTDFVAPPTTAVTPVIAEIITTTVPPNVLRRLGIVLAYNQFKPIYSGYGLVLARAENEGQISVNVYNGNDVLVKGDVPYSASGQLIVDMPALYKSTDGYIKELRIDNASGKSLIANTRLGYCGGEWFHVGSVTVDGSEFVLHDVERALWGSQLHDLHADDYFFLLNDDPGRVIGPQENKARTFYLTSRSYQGSSAIGDALPVSCAFTDNYNHMLMPSEFFINGNRVFPGDVPTLYRGDTYVISWLNRNRRESDFVGIGSGVGKSYEVLAGAVDQYFADMRDSADDNHFFGITGEEFDPCTEFNFTNLTVVFDTDEALGAATIAFTHQMQQPAYSDTFFMPILIAPKPGLVVDKSFNWRVGFAAEFTFDSAVVRV